MADEKTPPAAQNPPTPAQPATPQPRKAGTPDVFGDGSTKQQQEQLVKEAEAANKATKKFADAERDARSE